MSTTDTATANKGKVLTDAIAKTKSLKEERSALTARIALLIFHFIKKVGLLFMGYIFCYLNWSLTLPILAAFTLMWLETKTTKKSEKISNKSRASSMRRHDVLNAMSELPSWVMFPDRERAEWLNEIIAQLWPSINSYLVKRFRGPLQTNIRKKFDSFRFEDIDFGPTPPKIDGVKVYKRSLTKDSVIVDFDIYYDGSCDIEFSMSGAQIGSIKDFQFGAQLRLVLKPIMIKLPVIGGLQIFFLNTPDISFDLEGISGIPGFSYFIRQKIEEKITKKFVFPNKITKRFIKSVEAAELKSLEPAGVLRVHVFEAKDLEEKDVTGKSDPYAVLNVGAQEYKTKAVKRELNPKWDYWCEFIILDPYEQHLQFKLFDQDAFNEDEFLGSGLIDVHTVIKEGESDKWFQLDNVKHGQIHLRFTWLRLSAERDDLNEALETTKSLKVTNISTALLTVYLDMAEDLQEVKSKRPNPYVVTAVGDKRQKSKVKKHTCDPIWEQGFSILIQSPESDTITFTVIDKYSDTDLGNVNYNLRSLFDMSNMQTSKEVLSLSTSGRIIVSLQLRILVSGTLDTDDESDTSDDDELPTRLERQFSKSRTVSRAQSQKSSPKSDPLPVTSTTEVKEPCEKRKSQAMMKMPSFRTKPELGQIELTLSYSAPRQKLIIAVHKITNLPVKDNDLPDAYVKLKLATPGFHKLKSKTKVVPDNCDPVYEETFEYLVSESDLPKSKLILTAKSKKVFFNSDIIGQVVIDFKRFRDLDEPVREWFELQQAEDSD